jgi:hypothetical protein
MLISPAHNAQIQVYPNPAQGFLMVNLTEVPTIVEQVRILDMRGVIVQEFVPSEMDVLQVDVNHIPSGMYAIQVMTQGRSLMQKWIKD